MKIWACCCALFLLTGSFSFAVQEKDRGWGSSWTVPHSAEERQSRDLDARMKKALRAEDWPAVANLLQEGIKLRPNSMELAYISARVAMKRQRYGEAASHFGRMLTLPGARNSARVSSEIYTERAYANAPQGLYHASRTDLEHAIGLSQNNLHAQNNYAWLLATCPDASVRDGPRALSFARAMNQKLNGNTAMVLDTLAAAQAETGDFRSAVKTQERAISTGKSERLSTYQAHLQSYQRGQALRVTPEQPHITINENS